jgi:hypothetical protein
MPKAEPDPTIAAIKAVRAMTGTGVTPGEDLLGDPELVRKYRAAKERVLKRNAATGSFVKRRNRSK